MLSPIPVTNIRVEDRERREQSQQRSQKRQKEKPDARPHEENRGDRIDLTA